MLQSIKKISSYVQCKPLNVLSVYFYLNTLSYQDYFFQRVWGVYKIVVEILEGLGGEVISVVKKWKFRGGGQGVCKIPYMVGVWIFSGTTH